MRDIYIYIYRVDASTQTVSHNSQKQNFDVVLCQQHYFFFKRKLKHNAHRPYICLEKITHYKVVAETCRAFRKVLGYIATFLTLLEYQVLQKFNHLNKCCIQNKKINNTPFGPKVRIQVKVQLECLIDLYTLIRQRENEAIIFRLYVNIVKPCGLVHRFYTLLFVNVVFCLLYYYIDVRSAFRLFCII